MRRPLIGAVVALVAASSLPAAAQTLEGFALNRFEPAPAGDRFFSAPGALSSGRSNVRLMVLGDYAFQPLVLRVKGGDETAGNIVTNHLFSHIGVATELFQRLHLSLNVPVALWTRGDSPSAFGVTVTSPSGGALGDIRLGARVRVVGDANSFASLALSGYLWLPTGETGHLTTDGSVRGLPSIILSGEDQNFAYSIYAGAQLRPTSRFMGAKVGNEAIVGAAAGVLLSRRMLQVGPEFYAATTFRDAFERDTTNAEVLLGIKLFLQQLALGVAAGPGVTKGIGTPTLRALFGASLVLESSAPVAPADRDSDGIRDSLDACPGQPGKATPVAALNGCPDRDSDEIIDPVDACPDQAGQASEDARLNGCPKDRDRDGIADTADACPDIAGVPDSDSSKHGCPDDRDGDGIANALDACPEVRGAASPDAAKNGCPADSDEDGIPDHLDACPAEKGPADAERTKNGCPTLVRVQGGEIMILEQVQFQSASDTILPASDPLLQQVAAVLKDHPELKKLEVQGHTDDRGKADFNRRLSQKRAESVVKWLTTRGGIDPTRLEAKGYGKDQPIADNATEVGRQQNRRVQFKILDSAPPKQP